MPGEAMDRAIHCVARRARAARGREARAPGGPRRSSSTCSRPSASRTRAARAASTSSARSCRSSRARSSRTRWRSRRWTTRRPSELLRDLEQHLRITPRVGDGGRQPRRRLRAAARLGGAHDGDGPARAGRARPEAPARAAPRAWAARRCADGHVASTQETAWALLALDDYRRAREGGARLRRAGLGRRTSSCSDAPFHGAASPLQREVTVPMAKLSLRAGSPLAFQVEGSGALFYEARLRYAKKELPHDGLDRGLLRAEAAARGDARRASRRAGDAAVAERDERARGATWCSSTSCVVTPTPREQVVLDDPLPAGLEPVRRLARDDGAVARRDGGRRGGGRRATTEQTDDDARAAGRGYGSAGSTARCTTTGCSPSSSTCPRACTTTATSRGRRRSGTFVVPPTRPSACTSRSVFGRNAAAELQVTAP